MGKTQTSKYLAILEQRLEWLSNNPVLGKKRDEIKEGYISFPEGRHIIFYRRVENGIEVLGVIHQSDEAKAAAEESGACNALQSGLSQCQCGHASYVSVCNVHGIHLVIQA